MRAVLVSLIVGLSAPGLLRRRQILNGLYWQQRMAVAAYSARTRRVSWLALTLGYTSYYYWARRQESFR